MSNRRSSPGDLPLLRWGEALRVAALRRRRQRRILFGSGLAIGLLVATATGRPDIALVWNASASAPMGLYSVSPRASVRPCDMVIARVPTAFRALAAQRRYIPANVPLVKRVAAGPGAELCAMGDAVFIDGVPAAHRRARDGAGRPMPAWSGCHVLGPDELFLLMADSPNSFDGRYFGASRRADILGRARLLWAE